MYFVFFNRHHESGYDELAHSTKANELEKCVIWEMVWKPIVITPYQKGRRCVEEVETFERIRWPFREMKMTSQVILFGTQNGLIRAVGVAYCQKKLSKPLERSNVNKTSVILEFDPEVLRELFWIADKVARDGTQWINLTNNAASRDPTH